MHNIAVAALEVLQAVAGSYAPVSQGTEGKHWVVRAVGGKTELQQEEATRREM